MTIRSGGQSRQGASTLTQQLARSGLLGIGKEQTITRKFNEVLYALIMEARYDKRTIFEAYLNQVYLGQRGSQAIHGMSSGAEFWFGRDLQSLETEQIALLIGLVKGRPSTTRGATRSARWIAAISCWASCTRPR